MAPSAAPGLPRSAWGGATRSPAQGGTTLSRNRRHALLAFGLLIASFLLLGAGCNATGRFFGTTAWAAPLRVDIDGATVVVLGTRGGEVVAVRTSDGAELWSVETEDGRNNVSAVFGSPITDGRLVYAGGFDGVLYAIHLEGDPISGASAGQEAWSFTGDSAFVGGPALAEGLVVIGSEDGTLYGIEPPSSGGVAGRARWTFAADGNIWSTAAVIGGLALVGTLDGVLHAVHVRDDLLTGARAGEEAWRFAADAGIAVHPVVDDGVAYFGSFDGRFYAVDVDNGAPVWLEPFRSDNWIWAEPLLHDGLLYVPSLDHNLYVLDAKTGTELRDRRVETGGAIRGAPALVAGTTVLIANEAEETWWIDADTGTPRAGIALTSPAYAPVLSMGSTALIYTQNERLYRVAPAERQPVQIYPASR